MTTSRKTKVSVSLSADLVARIDREADKTTRSAVVERWLRQAEMTATARQVDAATIAYYDGLTRAAQDEDEAISRGLTRAARKLRIDDAPPPTRRRR